MRLTGFMSQWIQTGGGDLGDVPLSVTHMHSVLERIAMKINKWSLFLKCEMIILDHWKGPHGSFKEVLAIFSMCEQLEVQEKCSPRNNFFFFCTRRWGSETWTLRAHCPPSVFLSRVQADLDLNRVKWVLCFAFRSSSVTVLMYL